MCIKCFENFHPEGKFQRLCSKCLKRVKNENFKKMLIFRALNKTEKMSERR